MTIARQSLTVRTAQTSGVRVPQWWIRGDGHVVAGALLVRDGANVEAQILLDDVLVYQSRHTSRGVAEEELAALHVRCALEGWLKTN